MTGRAQSRNPATLTEQWVDRHEADLLARLEWELDAGWRTVTDRRPQPGDGPVYGPPKPTVRITPHRWARPHLRVVA